jgi:N-acetylglucosaminyl-diphospho-decaprenol L-rhamnosyltransferase
MPDNLHRESEQPVSAESEATVVIAIVGYQNANDIRDCVTALARGSEKDFIISICENGGAKSFKNLVSALQGLVACENKRIEIYDERITDVWVGHLLPCNQRVCIFGVRKNLGFAGGVNVCIRQLRATQWSAIWLLNPDTEPHTDALLALIKRAKEGPYSIVGSRIILKSTQRIQTCGGHWRPLMARGLSIGFNNPKDLASNSDEIELAMSYVPGASFFAAREFVESVGLMDERYFLYCEDVDWSFRRGNRRLGYAHESVVYHSHGTTIGSSGNRKMRSVFSVYLDERNRLLLTRRYYQYLYPLVVCTTLILTAQYLMAGSFKNFLVALKGWLAGLRGEEGMPKKFSQFENEWKDV